MGLHTFELFLYFCFLKITVVFSRGLHAFELFFLYFCFLKITVVFSRGLHAFEQFFFCISAF